MHHASCLCQGVAYAVSGDLPPAHDCHCNPCGRLLGVLVAEDASIFVAGQ